MALEGSLVLPIFLFFIMTVLLSLEAVRFQSDMQEALHQVGNNSAFECFKVKYENGEKSGATGEIREYMRNQLYPYLCIAEGEEGIILQETYPAGEDGCIELLAKYSIKPFIGWLPIGEIKIEDRFFSHGWTGYCGLGGNEGIKQEVYVYVTRTGNRYHMSHDCTYLRVQIQAVDYEQVSVLKNQSGAKYSACSRCRPAEGGLVYITSDGNSYHGRSDCASLKRTVYMIPLKEAEGYAACSKCAG